MNSIRKTACSSRKMGESEKLRYNHSCWSSAGLVLSLLLNAVVICCMLYGAHYFMSVCRELNSEISTIQLKYAQVGRIY